MKLIFISCILSLFLYSVVADWRIGASTVRLTPPVNGTTDYVKPVDEYDEDGPGTLVIEFDQGRIAIGNGDSRCNWVRDHVHASVLALQGTNNITLITISTDLYMLFGPDIEVYYERLKKKVGDEVFSGLQFIISSTHNHHGPDSSGLSLHLNRDWYSDMLDLLVFATETALDTMEPASLTVSDDQWMFGLGDHRDPRVIDPTLSVLQAKSLRDGSIIATLVQWAFHPEVTLGYTPVTPTEDCVALGEDPACTSRGRYMSADFPGHLRHYLEEITGGHVLYINGAVGNQIGPHGPVWEVSEQFPITGDGSIPPDGAELLPKNFRKTLLIGRELAYAVVRTLENSRAKEIPVGEIMYRSHEVLTRLNNVLFLAGCAPKYLRPNQPLVLGYALRELFICPVGVPPSFEVCEFDNYETHELAGIPLPIRKGNYAKAMIINAQIGPMSIFTIPGELAPELSNGLPTDFDLPESVSKYYVNPDLHSVGENYTMPGVLKDMLKCDYCFAFGLTMDAAGYIFPMSDWRIGCWGDYCDGDGYITGEKCKQILDEGIDEGRISCMLGQVNQVQDHYEETISASWDVANDLISAYSKLLGVPPSGRYTKPDWTEGQ